MKKLAFLFFKTGVVTYLILLGYFLLCQQKFTNNALFPPNDKTVWAQSLNNQTYDYALLGSSRFFAGCSNLIIDSITQKRGVNLASNGANFAESFLILHQFLGNNNKIETLVICTDVFGLNSSISYSVPLHTQYFIKYFDDEVVKSVLENTSARWQFYSWQIFPFWRYLEFNHFYSPYVLFKSLFIEPVQLASEFEKTMGFEMRYGNFSPSNFPYQKKKYDINPSDSLYFIKINQLANQHNLNLVYVTPPIYHRLISYQDNRQKSDFLFFRSAEKFSAKWINFEMNTLSNDSSNFRDNTHLSPKGVYQFSSQLALSGLL